MVMHTEITDDQLQRYARHIILDEVGEEGQLKLLQSRVLVVGAGGLGSPVLLYLAAAGVGTLGIIDFDTVDISNLQRQVIHHTDSVGALKVTSARETIQSINPEIVVNEHTMRPHCVFVDDDFRVDRLNRFPGAGDLQRAHAVGVMNDLTLQVGNIDRIEIDDPKGANTGRRQIKQYWRPQPAGADDQDSGLQQFELTFLADLVEDDVARISL